MPMQEFCDEALESAENIDETSEGFFVIASVNFRNELQLK